MVIKFFKNAFKKNIREEEKEIVEEETIDTGLICKYCERSIFGEQKVRTFGGDKYHVVCFRKLQKEDRRETFKLS